MLEVSIAGEKAMTPLDQEARGQVESYYAPYFTKCGEDTYISWGENGVGKLIIGQYRGLSISIHSNELTEADRLNGLEWEGYSQIEAKVSRTYETNERVWRPWNNGVVFTIPSPKSASLKGLLS